MTEISFYHLQNRTWEQVLPKQLSTALGRGWRCVVQVGEQATVDEVSELLWKNDADPFLVHGSEADGRAAEQPIWLTSDHRDNPNAASVRFFIAGAPVEDVAGLARAVILFDGNDETAVTRAREDWKRFKSSGLEISYFQQDESHRWVNKSKSED